MVSTGYKCLIVEDDPLICDLLSHFCEKSGSVRYSIAVSECREGLQLLSTEDFDLIFLDFNLPDMTGREFLQLKPESIPVIMVTSNASFAVDSYNYPTVIDFLLKPLDYQRFLSSLDKVGKQSRPAEKEASEDIFVKEGHSLVRIHIPDVSHIKSEGNYIRIFHSKGSVLTLGSLSKFIEELPDYFVRCHRSYLVNVKKVNSIHSESIEVVDGHEIPLTSAHKEEVLGMIKAL
jgi:DNA-binding LytR/AlgR family response regulator